MRIERQSFDNGRGQQLTARLSRPAGRPAGWALFAHCFTCSKDLRAAYHISDALSRAGIATLRFDFTGLGESEGDFADTTFASNVDDLVAAARHLEETCGQGPGLLVGHSFGGAAALQAAARIDSCRAVATINAPFHPEHVTHLLTSSRAQIEQQGEAEVSIAGRSFRVRREFLEALEGVDVDDTLARLDRALLVLHAPFDDIVGIDNASRLFEAARHPKSFVSLDSADHLLRDAADSAYAGSVIAAWSRRFLVEPDLLAPEPDPGVVVTIGRGKFRTEIQAAGHPLVADEPVSAGGADTGPGPYDLLLSSLGACTAMTLRMYADHKGWDLDGVRVRLTHEKVHVDDCVDCRQEGSDSSTGSGSGRIDVIEREIDLSGALEEAQRRRLLEIADRCPVHRTLHGQVHVRTRLGGR
jgi:uncharacterized OsmC-like protein/alpha/beta superfamily hydrolase